jgi:hypothetical protein
MDAVTLNHRVSDLLIAREVETHFPLWSMRDKDSEAMAADIASPGADGKRMK